MASSACCAGSPAAQAAVRVSQLHEVCGELDEAVLAHAVALQELEDAREKLACTLAQGFFQLSAARHTTGVSPKLAARTHHTDSGDAVAAGVRLTCSPACWEAGEPRVSFVPCVVATHGEVDMPAGGGSGADRPQPTGGVGEGLRRRRAGGASGSGGDADAGSGAGSAAGSAAGSGSGSRSRSGSGSGTGSESRSGSGSGTGSGTGSGSGTGTGRRAGDGSAGTAESKPRAGIAIESLPVDPMLPPSLRRSRASFVAALSAAASVATLQARLRRLRGDIADLFDRKRALQPPAASPGVDGAGS